MTIKLCSDHINDIGLAVETLARLGWTRILITANGTVLMRKRNRQKKCGCGVDNDLACN